MDEKRPILKLKYSSLEKVMEGISGGALIFMFLLIAVYWSNLPNQIATHYGFFGKPDSWSGKNAIFMVPILSLGLFFLLSWISRIPHSYNYAISITKENAENQYRNVRFLMISLKMEIICSFAYIVWIQIQGNFGNMKGLGVGFLPIFLFVIFGTTIYFIRRGYKLK